MNNKVFIVSPHFPPAFSPPAQRVRMIVNHIEKFSWTPIIFTVDQSKREEAADVWMNSITKSELEIIKVNCFSAKFTRKFGFGDLGLRMLPYLFFSILKQSSKIKPDLIYYPVPPWYILFIAPIVYKITGVKYVIDFIDPWVYNSQPKNLKAKLSQWIARKFESIILNRCSGIVAVSQGIIDDLKIRNPNKSETPTLALPYGVELSDYIGFSKLNANKDLFLGRYVGAISDAMLPIAEILISAICDFPDEIKVEFYGTSYASNEYSLPRLSKFISSHKNKTRIFEESNRVAYKKSIELSLESSFQILIGDTTKYYAASKLMSLIASQKPFIAVLHEESYPAKFLKLNNHQYLITYSDQLNKGILQKEIISVLLKLKANGKNHDLINVNNDSFERNTAFGMTKELAYFFNSLQ